jgi:hypothetical protein
MDGTVPFLEFFRTEHRVETIPCPRNGTIPFRPPRFQNRTHPNCALKILTWLYSYYIVVDVHVYSRGTRGIPSIAPANNGLRYIFCVHTTKVLQYIHMKQIRGYYIMDTVL